MIKAELICSIEYARGLNPLLNNNDWENLVINSQRFIYIVDCSGPSRTNPLTIKIDSNDNMLVKLIHELSHVNFSNSFNFNNEFYEDIINQVTEHISGDLSIWDCEALKKIVDYRNKLVEKGTFLEKIPFNLTNLKDHFGI